jgi:hypothetical protein
MRSTFYFAAMQKWLTSKPDRADWWKWAPRDWAEYSRMLTWLADRGKNVTRYFEVWNEPVPDAYWMGTLESVVELHTQSYQALHKGNPDAVVLGPCPYSFVWDFLEQFFKLGGGQWIDQLAIHANTEGDPDTGKLRENIQRVRQLVRQHGPERDIYITELGWGTPDVTESQQAQYLVRAYVLCLAERVKLLTWHMLWQYEPGDEPGYALLRHDGSPRPALVAYATLVRQLQRAKSSGEVPDLPSIPQAGCQRSRRGRISEQGRAQTRLLVPRLVDSQRLLWRLAVFAGSKLNWIQRKVAVGTREQVAIGYGDDTE